MAWGVEIMISAQVSGASQAARLLFSATGLAPYGSPLALELRRGGVFVAAARVGTAAVSGPCGNHFCSWRGVDGVRWVRSWCRVDGVEVE